jgi:hypothetical protein
MQCVPPSRKTYPCQKKICPTQTWLLPTLPRTMRLLKLVQLATPVLCHVTCKAQNTDLHNLFLSTDPSAETLGQYTVIKTKPQCLQNCGFGVQKQVFTPNDDSTTSTLRLCQISVNCHCMGVTLWIFGYRQISFLVKRCVPSHLGVRAAIRGITSRFYSPCK